VVVGVLIKNNEHSANSYEDRDCRREKCVDG